MVFGMSISDYETAISIILCIEEKVNREKKKNKNILILDLFIKRQRSGIKKATNTILRLAFQIVTHTIQFIRRPLQLARSVSIYFIINSLFSFFWRSNFMCFFFLLFHILNHYQIQHYIFLFFCSSDFDFEEYASHWICSISI